MVIQINVLATSLLMAILLVLTCRSGSIRNNNTKFSEETVSSTNDSAIPTAGVDNSSAVPNGTNGSTIHSATRIIKYVNTTQYRKTKPRTSPTHQSETTVKTTSPPQTRVLKSDLPSVDNSSHPAPQRVDKGNTEVLFVSLGLVVVVLAVCILITVLLVRWKRKKKMKSGFQEEMATICLHDELALEALYGSWKPFMDTSDTNNMKLVIEPCNHNARQSSTARVE